MKRSYMYEKCHGGIYCSIENSNMPYQQWTIMKFNFTDPFLTPSIIMIRHEKK